MQIPKDVLLFGSAQFVPSRRELRAGPLSVVLQDGMIRYVKLGEIEIIRRIYIALRDQNWNTIPTTYSNWKFEVNNDSFQIFFRAENKKSDIDFGWNGTITGDSSGKIVYSMSGKVSSTFRKRVIGLCALFPIREYAGQNATVLRNNREPIGTTFPHFISSDQPLPGFDDTGEIRFETTNGVPVVVKFEGDKFEMEDQRSFTDASFKVYSTWNRKSSEGDEVRPGDLVTQSISIQVGTGSTSKSDSSKTTQIEIDEDDTRPLPKIGLGASSDSHSLSVRELTLLKRIGISHIRGDLDLTSDLWRAQLRDLCSQVEQLSVRLELAVFVDSKVENKLKDLKDEIVRLHVPIESLLIFDKSELATKPSSARAAAEIFQDYFSHPRIGGGTDRNFYDLSFVHPSFDPQATVSYSANPQVHAFDVSSIVETLEGQFWTAKSAHKIYESNPVSVSPITLKPRFNPDEIVPEAADPDNLPSQVDPRQLSLFAACWTAGSVKSLSGARVSSLTYYETVGWRGLMESESGSKLPTKFPSKPGMLFPIYHVFSDICEMAGGDVHTTRSSNPLDVDSISLARGKSGRTIIFNLTWEPKIARIHGIKSDRVEIKRLNEETVEEAMFDCEKFRENSGNVRNVDGVLELSLLPYELARIDYAIM